VKCRHNRRPAMAVISRASRRLTLVVLSRCYLARVGKHNRRSAMRLVVRILPALRRHRAKRPKHTRRLSKVPLKPDTVLSTHGMSTDLGHTRRGLFRSWAADAGCAVGYSCCGACSTASASGIWRVKTLPAFGSLFTLMVPLCASTACFTIASPRPTPGISPTFLPR